jgi:hypothetical protein
MPTTVELLRLNAETHDGQALHEKTSGHHEAAGLHALTAAVYTVGAAILQELEVQGASLERELEAQRAMDGGRR